MEITATSFAQELIDTNPTHAIDGGVGECIEACFDCALTCTACADVCLGEEDVKSLTRCIRLNLDCSDFCLATGRILSRQTIMEQGIFRGTPSLRDGVSCVRRRV